MRPGFSTAALITIALLSTSCSSQEANAGGTDDTTRNLLNQPVGDGRSTPLTVDPSLVQEGGPQVSLTVVGFNQGLGEAPVKVVELSDYGCSYCRQFHEETFGAIQAEFIETGMVEWKFIPFINGMFKNSLSATEAVECTSVQDSEAFTVLNDRVWHDQSQWKQSDTPEELLRGWVSELGIDMEAFDACLANDERIQNIANSTTLAQQAGVRGTPTFVIIGYPPVQGALPLDVFQQVLNMAYSEATKEGGA